MDFDNGLENKYGTIVLLRNDEKTLMMKRDKKIDDFLFGKYVPPGGKIENGESPEECAKREFFEETDIKLDELIYRGKVLFDNKERNFRGKPAKFNFLVHIFESNSFSGTLSLTKDNTGTPLWVSNDIIKTLPIEAGDKYIFDWIEQGKDINHIIRLREDKEPVIEQLK